MPTALRRPGNSLKILREQASHCRACHLWKGATQTVFGAESKAREYARFVDDLRLAAGVLRKLARAA